MAAITNHKVMTARFGTIAGALLLLACSGGGLPTGAGGAGGAGGGGPIGSCPAPNRPTAVMMNGWATNPAFTGYQLTYPNDGQPMAGMVIITGFIVGVSSMGSWGPYLASKGIATLLIDPPTPTDLPDVRSRAQIAALASLKAEATRPGSPLNGKLDVNRLAFGGWSMGGGGTLLTTQTAPAGTKAAVAFAPWQPGGTFPLDRLPTLVFAGGAADSLVAHSMSRGEYDSIPLGTPKAYVEPSGADHFQWTSPNGAGGIAGSYTWAWLNAYVNGVSECKSVIARTPSMADFATSSL